MGQGYSPVKKFWKVVAVEGIAGKFLVTQATVVWMPASPSTLVRLTDTRDVIAAKSAQKLTWTSFLKKCIMEWSYPYDYSLFFFFRG